MISHLIEKLNFIQDNDMTHILLETGNIEYEKKILDISEKRHDNHILFVNLFSLTSFSNSIKSLTIN